MPSVYFESVWIIGNILALLIYMSITAIDSPMPKPANRALFTPKTFSSSLETASTKDIRSYLYFEKQF